jgi:hypothetical protein
LSAGANCESRTLKALREQESLDGCSTPTWVSHCCVARAPETPDKGVVGEPIPYFICKQRRFKISKRKEK